jgi:tRNA (adenine57-N1/adenine58-N1)-methyltransferase
VGFAKQAFRQNKVGKLCTFSPCIEQISKTVVALTEQGFVDIQMYECLIRFNEVRIVQMSTLDEALEMEQASEKKRKRALPRVLREEFKNSLQKGMEQNPNQLDKDRDHDQKVDEEEELDVKRVRMDGCDSLSCSASGTPSSAGTPRSHADVFILDTSTEPRDFIEPKNVTVTRLPAENRGHTSYLLFATFTPAFQQTSLTERNKATTATAGTSSSISE